MCRQLPVVQLFRRIRLDFRPVRRVKPTEALQSLKVLHRSAATFTFDVGQNSGRMSNAVHALLVGSTSFPAWPHARLYRSCSY